MANMKLKDGIVLLLKIDEKSTMEHVLSDYFDMGKMKKWEYI